MIQRIRWWAAGLLCAGFLTGCYGHSHQPAKSKPAAPASSGAAGVGQTQDAKGHEMEGEEHAAGPALSPEDQALADAQKICPVSDEEFGSMGPPVKELVKGEPVFLCCKKCIKELHSDEDKYLAKVAELKKANAAGDKPEEKKSEEK